MFKISRRRLLATTGAGIAAQRSSGACAPPIRSRRRDLHRAIEQQWVSRIHLAANTAKDRGDIEYVFSESVANTDYER